MRAVRAKDAERACLVWVTSGGQRQAGIITHREPPWLWVSLEDGGQVRVRAAALDHRPVTPGGYTGKRRGRGDPR